MSNQDPKDSNGSAKVRGEERALMIFGVVVVLIILGGMGLNVMYHTPTDASFEASSSNRVSPSQQ
jgi:hypothetical protein